MFYSKSEDIVAILIESANQSQVSASTAMARKYVCLSFIWFILCQ